MDLPRVAAALKEMKVLGFRLDQVRRAVFDEAVSSYHEISVLPADPSEIGRSARNRFVGLVTEILSDTVMSQVELQCGPHRVVSLMSTEAVRELGLEPGSVAIAVVKATTVIVETPVGGISS